MIGFGLGVMDGEEEGSEQAAVILRGEAGECVGAVGAGAKLIDHGADVGAEGGQLALVQVPCAFGNGVALSGAGRGKGLEKDLLRAGEWGFVDGEVVAASGGGVFELGADEGGVDAEGLGGIVGEGIAGDAAGNAADVGQEEVEGLGFGFGVANGKESAGAIDEVVLKRRRGAEGVDVGAGAAFADVAVGVESAVEGEDADDRSPLRSKGRWIFRRR